jgi:adenylate kinase
MHKYILMGAPGTGKGTQAGLLKESLDLVPISAGDIFRWNIQSHTKLGARIKRLVEAGQLVPDGVVAEVVRARLEQHDWNFGFVLDGFPRNRPQAEFFLESYAIGGVVLIDVPVELVLERALSRRLCSQCGLDHNLIHHRPAEPGACDVCGGALGARPDDNLTAGRERLTAYHTTTEPVLELLRRKGLVVRVDGARPPAQVFQDVRRGLGLGS